MNSILSYMLSSATNHDVININNHYNFFINWMNKIEHGQRTEFINSMRLMIGRTFTDNFKMYLFSKIPNSDLLKHFEP